MKWRSADLNGYHDGTPHLENLFMEWLIVGLELAVALIIALAVYLTLKK